jgi:hypothetical protein
MERDQPTAEQYRRARSGSLSAAHAGALDSGESGVAIINLETAVIKQLIVSLENMSRRAVALAGGDDFDEGFAVLVTHAQVNILFVVTDAR